MIIQKRYITFEALGPFASVQPSSSGFDPQAVTFSILPVTLKIASTKIKKGKKLQNWLVTAKRIRDRSIVSSIKPKFDNRFFVDLRVYFYKSANIELFCFDLQTGRTEKKIRFTTNTRHVNQQRIGRQNLAYIIEEILRSVPHSFSFR